MVLVLGDGIRSELHALYEGLQLHAGFQFTFAMVELSIYENEDNEYLAIPRTLAATHRVERGVVRFEGMVDRVDLGSVQSIAQTHEQTTRSISSDVFFSAMSRIDKAIPEKIQKLLAELEPMGVYPEFKKSLILRWGTPTGDVANLAYVQRNGQVWTDQVSDSLGDRDVALNYLRELASGIGGEMGEISGRPYVTQFGKAPQVGVLLENLGVMFAAVKQLTTAK